MSMDQTPDLRLYEAALDDGRAIVAVHGGSRDRLLEARDILAANGAHFQNHFGRYATEELSRWRVRSSIRAGRPGRPVMLG